MITIEKENKMTILEKIKYFYHEMKYWFPIRQIIDAKYYLKNRLIRKHHLIDTRLLKGQWIETDTRMLYGMMNLLVDFVEKERAFEIIAWESDEYHQKTKEEMVAILNWWKNYDNRLKEIKESVNNWSVEKFGEDQDKGMDRWIDKLNEPDTEKQKQMLNRTSELENKLEKEEEEMLIRLIKIRKFLWT